MIMKVMTVVLVEIVMREKRGGADKLNWRGFIQRISRTLAEGGEPRFNKREELKSYKRKMK